MSDEEPAVIVKDLYKTFKLPHEQHNGIKQAAVGLFNGQRGYEIQKVLGDISFEIKKGEFFGIVGRNGSGKSTLLKLLAGIYAPDKGVVQINGALTPFIELGVGFNPELTGKENVFLNGALLGFSRDEMLTMYDEIVTFAEIEKFMDQKLKNYSSGMQVRLAFSIAIRANTPILLIDEVLAVGDGEFQKKCYAEFRKMKEEKRTIIFVTHDMAAVERFCDRVLVIKKGKALGVYSPEKAAVIYERMNVSENPVKKIEEKNDKKHWGTGEVGVQGVELFDRQEGESATDIITQGNTMGIKLSFKNAENKARKINVGMAIHDTFGVNISGPNSERKKMNSGSDINFSIPKLPLAPGEYRLTVAVFDDNSEREYDHIEEAATFTVISQESRQFGKINLFGEWEQK